MDDWAAIEPRRWHELRRALRLLVWSGALALTQCLSVLSVPLLVVAGRSLVEWAPSRAVRRGAQLLFVSGIVQSMLLVTFVAAVLVDDDNRFPTMFVAPIVTVSILTSVLLIVGWIRALRSLCLWASATHIVTAWDRTIRRLPIAGMAIAFGSIAAVATDGGSFAILAAIAGLFVFWLVGHPTWWTYRLFRADLRPEQQLVTAGPSPAAPPPPPPSYWE